MRKRKQSRRAKKSSHPPHHHPGEGRDPRQASLRKGRTATLPGMEWMVTQGEYF